MGKEAKLVELWNKDRSFIESRGKEMSELLSELEDTEEEKAVIEQKAAEVDAAYAVLMLRIRDKDEKLMKKKDKLENFVEEKVSSNRKAKNQVERELEEIKDLKKVMEEQ